MKQTVYIDVLMGINLVINYFLLLAVSRFLSLTVVKSRLLLAALLGAVYSLFLLFPEISAWLSLLIKLMMSATIVLAAWQLQGLRQFLRELAAFYIISFAFAGFMIAIWYFAAPQGIIIKNSIVYFNISPLLLIGLTVLCYLVIRVIHRLTGRQAPDHLFYRIRIDYNGKSVSCMAKVDTGNALAEPFSNYPVAVVCKKYVADMIPQENSGRLRFIPFYAVSGGGLLPAFQPDKLTVTCEGRQYEIRNVYIAASGEPLGEVGALLNPDLLQKTSA